MCLNFFDPDVKARVHEDGLNSIIIPFMVPKGGRVPDELVKAIYNQVMLFLLIGAEKDGQPKP